MRSKLAGAKANSKVRPVNFAREVRSVLSDNCFSCHGPDDKRRKSGLRLDTKEGVLAKLKSGGVAIVPGKPDESDLIDRIETDDPDAKMPPKKSGKQLTVQQIQTLRRWVEQGASWTTPLGVRAAPQGQLARCQGCGMAPKPDRPVHPGPARGRGVASRPDG